MLIRTRNILVANEAALFLILAPLHSAIQASVDKSVSHELSRLRRICVGTK
jgi:hypothetical protein